MKNISAFILLLSSLMVQSVAANEFPGRSAFPEQEIIEIDDLYKNRANMIIIDTRTDFEYNVIHITNSVHANFEADDYIDRLREIRKSDNRKMVFYCNGLTCTKAFRAHAAAAKAGIRNTATFDAGVFTWARTYPDEAVLMGKSPVDPNRLLSREALVRRLLDANSFSERVGKNSLVLDVRDESQREATQLYPFHQRNVTLDDPTLADSIKKAAMERKTVLIYDYTGQQVRWVQYLMESLGVSDYYFLKGGFRGFMNL
jgi:rhodanese-related sulfurtransferase